jgi:hypothetical protein
MSDRSTGDDDMPFDIDFSQAFAAFIASSRIQPL